MYFTRLCLDSLRYNKLRSILTGLGVLIGVASVVLITTLTSSLFAHLSSHDSDRFTVGLVSSAEADQDVVAALATGPMRARVQEIVRRSDVLTIEAPARGHTVPVRRADGTPLADFRVAFADEVEVVEGLPFDQTEGNVAILYANPEFADTARVGGTLVLRGAAHTIVGLTQSLGADGSTRLFLPTRAASHIEVDETPGGSTFTVTVRSAATLQETRKLVLASLNEGLDASLKFVDFSDEEGAALKETFQTLGLFLGLIASISLAVAALNIVNVMYISALERADEVAIYRSLGMTKGGVRSLFLSEALAIVTLFAVLGCVLGYAIALVILTLAKVPMVFHWLTGLLLMAVVLIVGAGAGLSPANKAASVDPVRLLH